MSELRRANNCSNCSFVSCKTLQDQCGTIIDRCYCGHPDRENLDHFQKYVGCIPQAYICDLHPEIVKQKEEEQNKIVVSVSVVSSELDLDSPIFRRSKMPKITDFPGDIKEEES